VTLSQPRAHTDFEDLATSLDNRSYIPAGGRTLVRLLAVYSALVITPAAVAVVFLLSHTTYRPRAAADAAGAQGSATFVALVLAIVIIVGACAVVGTVFRRIGQPPVVGEILTGIVLGPSVLGVVSPGMSDRLLPPEILPQLSILAQLGVIMFAFLAGLELNTADLRGRGDVAVVISHASIAVPFVSGVALALLAYDRFAPGQVGFLPFALFLGASMSVTALPVMARILMDKGMLRSDIGAVAITCALVDDVTAWSLLAVVVALTIASSATGVLLVVGLTAAFAFLMARVVGPLVARIGSSPIAARSGAIMSFTLVGLLLSSLATEAIGIHSIFGAFIFGMVCHQEMPVFQRFRDKITGLTEALLLPLFFTYSGLRTDISLLGFAPKLWLWCGFIFAVAVIGKLAGSAVGSRAVGLSWATSLQLGALMNCRGLTELVVLNIGLDLGVLSPELFTMLVLTALASTAMTAPIVGWLRGRDGAVSRSAVTGDPQSAIR
jgi:Kef-type K+ transport system membrane component KefB